jgi:hypothetical protein
MATTLRQFLNDLDRVVQQTQVNMAMKLAKGACPNMEEYNRAVGRSEGMEMAVKTARDMLGQMEAAAEEEGGLPEMPQAGQQG